MRFHDDGTVRVVGGNRACGRTTQDLSAAKYKIRFIRVMVRSELKQFRVFETEVWSRPLHQTGVMHGDRALSCSQIC